MESDRRNMALLHNSEYEDELTKEARMRWRLQHLHDGLLKMASVAEQTRTEARITQNKKPRQLLRDTRRQTIIRSLVFHHHSNNNSIILRPLEM